MITMSIHNAICIVIASMALGVNIFNILNFLIGGK